VQWRAQQQISQTLAPSPLSTTSKPSGILFHLQPERQHGMLLSTVQVQANCAVLRGCMAAGRLQEALDLCAAALKAVPQASHVELLVCKSTILARSGQQAPEEMSRLGVYPAPVQVGSAWAAFMLLSGCHIRECACV
jgi:hypothetical protein